MIQRELTTRCLVATVVQLLSWESPANHGPGLNKHRQRITGLPKAIS